MKRYIKSSYSDYSSEMWDKVRAQAPGGYLYIFKHGVGPGTIPKDAAFLKEKDLPNGYTAVWLDRFLTDRELKAYDIPSETEINYYLDRIGYCQKNGDVVPCDDIEACGDIKASRTIDRWDHNTEKYEPVEIPDDWNVTTFSSDLDEEVNCVHCGKPLPYGDSYCSRRYHDKYGMGYAECEDCYEEQLKDEFGNKDIEACNDVMASQDIGADTLDKIYDLYEIATRWCDDPKIDQILIKNGTSPDSRFIVDENTDVMQAYADLIDYIKNNINSDSLNDREYALVYGDVEACDKVTASDICYRDRDNDDSVVALDAGMSDEDVEKMLAEHPSYYRSTLDRFEACNDIMASTNGSQGDFTVIQEIYDDGPAYMTEDNVEPVCRQEYDVNLDEVIAEYPEVEKYALKGWTDETFKPGDIITKTHFAKYVEFVARGESDQLYSDFKAYVNQHPEFNQPARSIEVRINNPQCLPSGEAERRRQSEELGRYLGKKLGLGRW